MNKELVISLDSHIRKIKMDCELLRNQISTLKPNHDISMDYYLKNLQKMSLQSLDLFSAMQKQVSLLNNRLKFTK